MSVSVASGRPSSSSLPFGAVSGSKLVRFGCGVSRGIPGGNITARVSTFHKHRPNVDRQPPIRSF